MTEKKTTLPSLRDQDLKKVKLEKVNKLLPNIPTNNMTELNELIFAGGKLASDKTGVLLRSPNRNPKPGLEIRLEEQAKNLRQQDAKDGKIPGYVGMKRPKQNSRQLWQNLQR